MGTIEYQQILSLTIEQLSEYAVKREQHLDFGHLRQDVCKRAVAAGLLSQSRGPVQAQTRWGDMSFEEAKLAEPLRHAWWECFRRGLIVPGCDEGNPNWPWFTITELGRKSLKDGKPQPYDPDRFIEYFRGVVTPTDPIVDEYFVEAVHAFNAECLKSCAVMLRCASEQLTLLICGSFGKAIVDSDKRASFEKDSTGLRILTKYNAMKKRLERLVELKKLPQSHVETVRQQLHVGFHFIRRNRNSAGHPSAQGDLSGDTMFIDLRGFIEYARRATDLVQYFATNPVSF